MVLPQKMSTGHLGFPRIVGRDCRLVLLSFSHLNLASISAQAALTKVYLCHLLRGNPENFHIASISKKALNSHFDLGSNFVSADFF